MITRKNILAEYPRISQNALPKALQQKEFDFIVENFDLIDDDKDIRKYVDTFIKKLNEALKKSKQAKPKQPLEIYFLKWYCRLHGRVKTQTQVLTFINRLQKAIVEKKIRKTSEFAAQIDYIQNRLIAFYNNMKSSTKTYEIPADRLEELKVICNVRLAGLGNIPADTPNLVVSAADFKNASFNLMGFTGKWLQLIGNPSAPYKMMVWGTGGSGKSTLAIEFAKYLTGKLNKRVLYIANEEGAGATLHEKMTRLNAFNPNLFITKTLPTRLVEYDFIFCDSANSMQLDLPKFEEVAKLYPYLSWVLMFQTTKDGNFLGEKNWQHAVDVEIYCNEGKAKALKTRFGGKEEVGIF